MHRSSLILLAALTTSALAESQPKVELLRLPEGAIQPQLAQDSHGLPHLVYFKGEAKAGDLWHATWSPTDRKFGSPNKVNSIPDSGIAVGAIRGAQIAIGQNDRLHVVWNGAGDAKEHRGAAMWYTRSRPEGGFEPQRDLITHAAGLDGGGGIAADQSGAVWVFWHAAAHPKAKNEQERTLWVAKSTDNGANFAKERRALTEDTGACGCCGMKAWTNGAGGVFALFRAAYSQNSRPELLVTSNDKGESFQIARREEWDIKTCPMSSAAFASGPGKSILAAWETNGQVYWSQAEPGKDFPVHTASGTGKKRKHPVIARNSLGQVLFAWTEGTGWQKGGGLVWQAFDLKGQPYGEPQRTDGVPVWGLAAATALPDGSFAIFY